MTKLAIIGTAGRGDDARQLTAAHWRMMTCIAQTVACTLGARHLVSGGSAFADHVAVQLYLDGHADHLTLHLPCQWRDLGPRKDGGQHWAFEGNATGQRLNQLHSAFAEVTGLDPWAQIAQAIERGASVRVNPDGFKARNADVAAEADALLAFTFSGGALPSDGGTAHTWGLFRAECDRRFAEARAHYEESACGCSNNQPDGWEAYHFDLIQRQLHRHFHRDPVRTADRERWASECEEAREARAALSSTRSSRTAEEEALNLL